ncbi:hypothetical protein ABIA69_003128 [Lysinibacillus parviboronicapiens]|uniref:Uncharacterized protein n=1 Tax=Lysinibacillus parviboronicapiens TaxID=436516 RepID=A0ABV2PLY9_9BACI
MYGYVRNSNYWIDPFGLTLYHYTDSEGAKAIQESGVIRPDSRGRVFVTTNQISAKDVNNALLMGQKPDVGTHVV